MRNLRKMYGEKVALADISFAVAPGEIFGILGPNGSGQSTAVESAPRACATPTAVRSAASLKDERDAQFRSLSGGEKQQVSIALALVNSPKVAILDELSTGLDPQARRTTWEVVRRERDAGATVLLVLVIIDRGHVFAEGSPQDLIDSVAGAQSPEDLFVGITAKPAGASTTRGA